MSTTPHGTLEETGAKANDILFGINRLNEDMLIQVLSDQESNGKRIDGSFVLIRAGVGAYAEWLKAHEGRVMEAKELIDEILTAEGKGKRNLHILNRNQLKLHRKIDDDSTTVKLIDEFKSPQGNLIGIESSKSYSIRDKISESNLEHFLIANLEVLEAGLTLVKQQLDCREAGRLDLLCRGKNGDLVIVELKKSGVNHDFVVGQILRYIGYVRAHIASEGQNVRGIIVVGRLDEKLRYAAAATENIEVKVFNLTIS